MIEPHARMTVGVRQLVRTASAVFILLAPFPYWYSGVFSGETSVRFDKTKSGQSEQLIQPKPEKFVGSAFDFHVMTPIFK
jgi:hypothetical protein